jgi:hypothetical protein
LFAFHPVWLQALPEIRRALKLFSISIEQAFGGRRFNTRVACTLTKPLQSALVSW